MPWWLNWPGFCDKMDNPVSKLLTTRDENAWREILPIRRSVFGSVEYARILEQQHGYQARLFTYERADSRHAYPLLLRPIEPLYPPVSGACFDTLSPEYTGPLMVSGSVQDGSGFRSAWAACCRDLGIVAEFAHLHPWDAQVACLDAEGVAVDREIVYVDLTVALDTLREEHFTYACRKNLRRAESEGVEVSPASNVADLDAFCRIYSDTMDRNNALSKYYFSREYFGAFFETLPNNACFMLARYQGKIIAGTLYLHDDSDVYSYLGGADQAYQHARPSNAVVFETIRWAQAQGKRRLILGGGYMPDDGIFRFKASFSPLRAQFNVYRKIHSPSAYRELTQAWERNTGSDPAATRYFPIYRSPEPARSE